MGVGASQIEVELVEGNLGQEVGATLEGFQVEELVLNEAMDSFDVALEGVSRRRDALVLRAEVSDRARKVRAGAVGLELADEFAAVVGLPSHVTQGDAAARQVALDALGEPLAGLGRALGSVSQELQAAADLAGRVLDGG